MLNNNHLIFDYRHNPNLFKPAVKPKEEKSDHKTE